MARDTIADRFSKRQDKQKLDDLGQKARSKEDVEGEKELIKNTDKVEPIKASKQPQRNDPCPCGSDKKFKKCCGANK